MTVASAFPNDLPRICACGRKANWLWRGNEFDGPTFLCGYHKRAYITVERLVKPSQLPSAGPHRFHADGRGGVV